MHPAQDLHRQLHHVVAGQHVAAKLGAGLFDLPRQGHFLAPRQQRDLAHLRQVHPHRVVRPGLVFVHALQQAVDVDVQIQFVQLGREVGHVANQIVVRVVESRDGIVGQIVDDFVRARRCVVVQFVQQCVVQCNSPQSSSSTSSPQFNIMPQAVPKATKFYHCFPVMIPRGTFGKGFHLRRK